LWEIFVNIFQTRGFSTVSLGGSCYLISQGMKKMPKDDAITWSKIYEMNEQARESIMPYVLRLKENFDRVLNLARLWTSLKESEELSSNSAIDEILRATVVFTHATLEDFLRTIAAKLLPESTEQTLNQIPLIGSDSPSGRAEKFSLGRLAKLKGKTVDQVITDSVLSYLEHSNFNSVKDIVILLESIDLDVTQVDRSFPKIEEFMKRRHLIVHRADRYERLGTDQENIMEIDGKTVLEWIEAVMQFVEDVLPIVATRHLKSKS